MPRSPPEVVAGQQHIAERLLEGQECRLQTPEEELFQNRMVVPEYTAAWQEQGRTGLLGARLRRGEGCMEKPSGERAGLHMLAADRRQAEGEHRG